jgi:hypothetical protein
MLQDPWVVMPVNHLAWRNKFLMNSALTVLKAFHHALDVQTDLPVSSGMEQTGFSTERTAV